MNAAEEFLRDVLAETFEIDPESVRPGVRLEELGIDSLALAELAYILGESHGIEIAELEGLGSGSTVGEVAAVLDSKGAEREARTERAEHAAVAE